jgi:hypothetical protein
MRVETLGPELTKDIHFWLKKELAGSSIKENGWVDNGYDCGPRKVFPGFSVNLYRYHDEDKGPLIHVRLWIYHEGEEVYQNDRVTVREPGEMEIGVVIILPGKESSDTSPEAQIYSEEVFFGFLGLVSEGS